MKFFCLLILTSPFSHFAEYARNRLGRELYIRANWLQHNLSRQRMAGLSALLAALISVALAQTCTSPPLRVYLPTSPFPVPPPIPPSGNELCNAALCPAPPVCFVSVGCSGGVCAAPVAAAQGTACDDGNPNTVHGSLAY